MAMNLLEDDQEWTAVIKEVCVFASRRALRVLFATALLFAIVADPTALWLQFCGYLCDDLHYWLGQMPFTPAYEGVEFDFSLYLLNWELCSHNCQLSDFNLPRFTTD
ncbi:uncharacterized protein P174DRAFT_434344 [Aspergillus novofumigatus IBT 16806]|uniref:Uncharacterized protein n=1 Tax=Aspergillus novofumigatus (strain IBT 16806) TaxID=1392255 RepID=A0A2I1C145_ASPN1|nr:uncharacterized protein P174DRAFT_434344 [Aspergillus novofumigatus IBT 16806]PKX91301.1 hypothetical protein P174DRAFT_434344 [Aspergillus novofumigatus IBT 16806]